MNTTTESKEIYHHIIDEAIAEAKKNFNKNDFDLVMEHVMSKAVLIPEEQFFYELMKQTRSAGEVSIFDALFSSLEKLKSFNDFLLKKVKTNEANKLSIRKNIKMNELDLAEVLESFADAIRKKHI